MKTTVDLASSAATACRPGWRLLLSAAASVASLPAVLSHDASTRQLRPPSAAARRPARSSRTKGSGAHTAPEGASLPRPAVRCLLQSRFQSSSPGSRECPVPLSDFPDPGRHLVEEASVATMVIKLETLQDAFFKKATFKKKLCLKMNTTTISLHKT